VVAHVNVRENESCQGPALGSGALEGPAIETVIAAMQAEPGLWAPGVYLSFSASGGAEVRMHGKALDEVAAMASLLGIGTFPVRATTQGDPFDPVVVLYLQSGTDAYHGGIEIKWFTTWPVALTAYGLDLSVLLNA
jgi:hypothetical protein